MASVQWKYVSPLQDSTEIEALEIKYHYPLPEDLKACVLAHNGGTPSPCLFDFGENKNMVFGGLLSFNADDPDSVHGYIELFRSADGRNLAMFPFGIDPAGNFLCLRSGSVVFYDHEAARALPVCGSFTQFLDCLHA